MKSTSNIVKQDMLKIAINRAVYKKENTIKKRHFKKFNEFLHERNQIDGIASNPNNITILSNHTLSNNKYNVLKYSLEYGISVSPKSSTFLLTRRTFEIK